MYVRDITFGILLAVISLFPIAAINFIIGPLAWWVLPSVVFLSISFHYLIGMAWAIGVSGVFIDDE